MDLPVDQKLNDTYFKSSSTLVTGCCEQNETTFHLYLHQNFSGPNQNESMPVKPQTKNSFGWIVIHDLPITEGVDPGTKIIARAQGLHTQSGQNKQRWYYTSEMVFEDDSFNGSTLEVCGSWDNSSSFEWAIVGGTGQLTLAQGTVSGTKLSEDANGRVFELFIHVFYRTIQKYATLI